MLKAVASPLNQAEADMLCERLSAVGIRALQRRNGPSVVQMGGGGAREVLVEEADFDRARDLLAAPDISEDELAALSMRSFEEITGSDPSGA